MKAVNPEHGAMSDTSSEKPLAVNKFAFKPQMETQEQRLSSPNIEQVNPDLKQPAKHQGGTNTTVNIPSFLVKTYDLVSDPSSNEVICWNPEGNGFIVLQVNKFSEEILPKYFKHNNFSSFIRQLNMYDFHKTRNAQNQQCFQHSLFLRDDRDSLKDIKRKNSLNVEKQLERQQQQLVMNQHLLSHIQLN